MTETTQLRPVTAAQPRLNLHYWVAMPQPASHLLEVTLQVSGWDAPQLDLKMPVWTPGSYLVREYARHVQNFQTERPWQKLAKNHWQIETAGVSDVTLRYQVFANELTVRTNHLDTSHAFFNGAALFFYLPGLQQQPIRITIQPPTDWQIATALPPVTDQTNTFEAADFDQLVDSPFEIGLHQRYEFEALGKPHQFVIWGQSNAQPAQLIADTQKIIQVEAELFGGLPYERYLFILHQTAQGFGGLEHKDSCALIYPRFGFRSEESYQRFMQLVAHEFFHLWNVKRIRPKGLEAFDYEAENYTPSLWFCEGTTSYYDVMLPLRAGIYDARTAIKLLGKEISRFLTTPGRLVQPLGESSFDAWIKLYRRDSNSDNNQISYYLKGEMLSLILDLLIRAKHDNRRSLDDVLRQLWQQFGQPEVGFTPEQLQMAIESVAGAELSDLFELGLHSTQELPLAEYLEPFGLKILPEDTSAAPPHLGLKIAEGGRELVRAVEFGSPAQQAGIDPDDELLALDGFRVRGSQLAERLKQYRPQDTVQLTLFHQDELRTYAVKLGEPQPQSYQLVAVESASEQQSRNFAGWLGAPLTSLAPA
ncbi:MAG: M61 family metallopeptidase [Pegethrix bostrychoides GSE-TBD4-15B]|jgi:predicted metalloprotease with PDZ domain|uniref:M61 family metallopeptidase n=1 Tax=Pegethrix bostrychoides GSE-TBD4-15B TaxID=2839662 RepID=A0A951U4S1_9CYAN|nr:M61 family metallopeptidase [Pegethrix bostrychoides GSE-TBD4-15B]